MKEENDSPTETITQKGSSLVYRDKRLGCNYCVIEIYLSFFTSKKFSGQIRFVSEQFQNTVIYAYFYKISLKIACKKAPGKGFEPQFTSKTPDEKL
jgi:hypothetical protein